MRKTILKKINLDFFNIILLLFITLLPTQFGKHFFLNFSYINGVRVDYLTYVLYTTDVLALTLIYIKRALIIDFFKNKTVVFVFFLFFLSMFFSISPEVALFKFWKIFEVTSLFVIFSKIKIKENLLFLGIFLSCLIELIVAISQFVYQHSIQGFFYLLGERYFNSSMPGIAKIVIEGNNFIRPYGTFSHPNSLAGYFLLIYAFILATNLNKKLLFKNLILLTSSLLIFISFSKTAIIAYLAVNIIYLFMKFKKSECKVCVLSRTFIFSLASIFFLYSKSDPLSLLKRGVLFKNSIDMLLKYPITGVGLGNYLIGQAHIKNSVFSLPVQPVHNIFMLFLCEVGIFLGFGIMYLLFKNFYKYKKSSLFILCFIVFFLTGFFDHYWLTLQQNFLLLGVLFGLITNPRVASL